MQGRHPTVVRIATYAADQGCGRMDWNVVQSNARGIAFYESPGAWHVADRLSYRLAGAAMDHFAGPQDPALTA